MAEDKDKPKGLTIEQLRKLKNYENISDEQAQETVFAIKNLAALFYEYLNKKKREQEIKNEIEKEVSPEKKIKKSKIKTSLKKRK